MNIHSEYCILPEGAVLPDESIKVLGIHSEGFYFLIHHGTEILYALQGSFRSGLSENALRAVIDRKPVFRMAEFNRLLLLPDSFVAVPDVLLSGRSEAELFEMVSVLPGAHQILKSGLSITGTSLLSALPASTINMLNHLKPEITADDWIAVWLNKINVTDSKPAAHIMVFQSKFVIAVFNCGKLQIINSFNYSEKSDFLYYLLGAVSSCELDPSSTELWLCGEITPSSPLAEALGAYFSNVRYDAAPAGSDHDSAIISSMFFPLFQQ